MMGYWDIWSLKTQINKNHMYNHQLHSTSTVKIFGKFSIANSIGTRAIAQGRGLLFSFFLYTTKVRRHAISSPASQFFAESQINASHSHHAPHPIPCMT